MERRFLNPYRRWVAGLAVEIVAFAAFVAALLLLAGLITLVR